MPSTLQPAPGASDAGVIDTDVIVVGLGPVGAALAALLGRYGIRVLAIDKATEIFTKPRAIALDNEALRMLQLVGVEQMLDQALRRLAPDAEHLPQRNTNLSPWSAINAT